MPGRKLVGWWFPHVAGDDRVPRRSEPYRHYGRHFFRRVRKDWMFVVCTFCAQFFLLVYDGASVKRRTEVDLISHVNYFLFSI